ncbi:MAG: beta-galactosidase [Candidatus Hydrogenedentes bacterium]|nr:beta-galactosidase [Candidatus Hydrogenedentota bacterium]
MGWLLSGLVVLGILGADLPQDGVLAFDAAAPGTAVLLNGRIEGVGDAAHVVAEDSTDPYAQVYLEIPLQGLPDSLPETILLEVRFHDEGACLIEPGLQWGTEKLRLAPVRRSGYTRLNTHAERTGWYAFTLPEAARTAPTLSFVSTGLQHVRSIQVLPMPEEAAWTAHDAAIPKKVEPMVRLKRPIEAVTTAGVDVRGGMDTLEASLKNLNEIAPLTRVLGFSSIESYVTWKRLEPNAEGDFDFSYYDAVVKKLAEYDLKWFPLLIVGSAYALPEWFLDHKENVGMVCLEHGLSNPVQSIWYAPHRRHVERVLHAFGDHYEPMGVIEGVRLGPSGNYGESQYPAGGNWGIRGNEMHIHIGWWAGDPYALQDFRRFLLEKYGTLDALNAAWESHYAAIGDVRPELPSSNYIMRRRLDFTQWYTDSMTQWCEWWGEVARAALPKTVIYQSAGGWGFRESGTDYSGQAKSMVKIDGGIRLTNETDSYEQNIYATRLATTAAKFYGLDIGFEPASSHTARGVVGRLYNLIATDGRHFFTYEGNIINHPMEVERWLKYLPLAETRQRPVVDVAVYYPETANQIDDGAFRHLYAWGFNPRAAAVRRVVDVDYLDERLIREGALDQYKVLVFAWGDTLEEDVLQAMDAWVQRGGVLIYPAFPRGLAGMIEGDTAIFKRWQAGETGQGAFHRFQGDMEPTSEYGDFVKKVLAGVPTLDARVQAVLKINAPDQVFFTVQEDGHAIALNYRDEAVTLAVPGAGNLTIEPYGIARFRTE